MKSNNGNKRMNAAGGVALFVGMVSALGIVWKWNHLDWWPQALESVNIIGATLGAAGFYAKWDAWRARRGKEGEIENDD
jgi:hypothetical protein